MIYRSQLLFLLLALLCSLSSAQKYVDEAFSTIQSYVKEYSGKPVNQCKSNNCCKLSDGACNLSSFPKDKTTLVFPGGETRCIYSYSTDFAFQVIPGDNDKVVLYFQGGGACWDEISTNAGFCSSDAMPTDYVGIFDHSDSSNPYKSYTVIQVLYCSGDLHAGDVTREYTDDDGVPITQSGQANTNSVLSWIAGQQQSGQLASTLSDLVIMGCSAGAIGAQIWAETALKQIQYSRAAVEPDSYAGVFPEGTQGPLIYGYGACSAVDPSLQASCNAQTLTLQDITSTSMSHIAEMPGHVSYGFIQSKADAVQISFYIAVGALTPDADAAITPEQFYKEVNHIFEQYNTNANFVNFMVNGNKHCFTNSDVVYTADTTGPSGTPSSGEPTMISWLGDVPVPVSESVKTDCYGTLLSEPDWTGTEYCDAALAGKSYTNDGAAQHQGNGTRWF